MLLLSGLFSFLMILNKKELKRREYNLASKKKVNVMIVYLFIYDRKDREVN